MRQVNGFKIKEKVQFEKELDHLHRIPLRRPTKPRLKPNPNLGNG